MRWLLPLLLLPTLALSAPRVGVLYFGNDHNPDLAMLKVGLAQMLITELAQEPGIVVLERSRLNDVLAELELQKTANIDDSTAVAVGKLLGADTLVHGSFFELAGQLRMDAHLIDVQRGVVVGSASADGAVAQFSPMLSRLREQLAPQLRGLTPAPTPETAPEPSAPSPIRGGTGMGPTAPARRAQAPAKPSREAQSERKRKAREQHPPAGGDAEVAWEDAEASESVDAQPPVEEPGESGVAASADAVSADPIGAALAFSEGLDYLDRDDLPRARDALRRALTLDPSLEPARDELARIGL